MRKTYTDYKKEYDNILMEQKAIESRIKDRAKTMSTNHPHITVAYRADEKGTPIKAPKYFNEIEAAEFEQKYTGGKYVTTLYLYIIKTIEQYNEKQASIKQLKMFE